MSAGWEDPRRQKRLRKQLFKALVGLLSVVAVSLSSAVAVSADSTSATANIQSGNAFCGFNAAYLPVIGFTNYHRYDNNTVHVNYRLREGIPNSTYYVQLWGDACSFFGSVATITTASDGSARGEGSVAIPHTSTRFFATAFGPNGYNDTPAVTLLPPS